MGEDFYKEAFEGYDVPECIKQTAISICDKYDIKGLADPMYVANVIGMETGTGDGQGNFKGTRVNKEGVRKVAERLAFAYRSNKVKEVEVEEIVSKYSK